MAPFHSTARLVFLAMLLTAVTGSNAAAQPRAVIELFTSQGCCLYPWTIGTGWGGRIRSLSTLSPSARQRMPVCAVMDRSKPRRPW